MDWQNESTGFLAATRDDWQAIFQHTLAKLEAFMGCKIAHEAPTTSDFDRGFCISISSPKPADGPLRLSWQGILGATVLDVDTLQVPCISASIFVYINRRRVVTKDGYEFFELRYVGNPIPNGHWESEDWTIDEHHEYEWFDFGDTRRHEDPQYRVWPFVVPPVEQRSAQIATDIEFLTQAYTEGCKAFIFGVSEHLGAEAKNGRCVEILYRGKSRREVFMQFHDRTVFRQLCQNRPEVLDGALRWLRGESLETLAEHFVPLLTT